jgi:hypothetical protein
MPDEAEAILEIMRAVDVHDFAIAKVKDKAEAARMFKDDFSTLVGLCQEGNWLWITL